MRKRLKTTLTATAVLAALAAGSVLYAATNAPDTQSSERMMRGEGDMMDEMSQMMETCNKMMKEMAQHHGPDTPKARKNPGNKG